MFLLGFIGGVLVLTVLLLLCDTDEEDVCDERDVFAVPPDVQATQNWQQTRNFLYYDGTEMPLKKEEQYE